MGYAVIIGGANIDICGTPSDKFIPGDSNPGKIKMTYGGVARNIAHQLRLLGINVKFISAFGDDAFARELISSCEKLGMDISHSFFGKQIQSSVYSFITDEKGDMIAAVNDMDVCKNINKNFLSEKLDLINGADICFIDTNNTVETLTYITDNCKVPIFTDPVSSIKAVKLKSVLSKLYAIKPNAMEASILTGIDVKDEESARRCAEKFISLGIKRVYISLGEKGVYASNGSIYEFVSPKTTEIVNTNGAGDSFMSAVIYSYIENRTFEESISLGMAASSLCLKTENTINENMNAELLEKLARS